MEGACDGTHPFDPLPGWLKALETAPRHCERCSLDNGLSAVLNEKLSYAARLGTRRPGNIHDRGDGHRVRSSADRTLAGTFRLHETRKSQWPLYSIDR